MKLLLIEDDSQLTLALYRRLSSSYKIESAPNGKSGLRAAQESTFNVIILDLNLPDMNGLQVCEQLRASGNTTPILVLSGEAAVESKVNLLDSGADDYLTKPFDIDELCSRLRSVIRSKHNPNTYPTRLVAGNLLIDTLRHRVEIKNKELHLSRKEFAILEHLMSSGGAVISREDLAQRVWDEGWAGNANTIDVHIKYLRDKVDRPYGTSLIKTVRGVGYKIDAPISSI